MSEKVVVIEKSDLALLINQAVADGFKILASRNELPLPVEVKTYPCNMRDELAAQYLGVKPGTLRNWRANGKGPSYSKHEKVVTYNIKDLDLYNQKRKVKTHE